MIHMLAATLREPAAPDGEGKMGKVAFPDLCNEDGGQRPGRGTGLIYARLSPMLRWEEGAHALALINTDAKMPRPALDALLLAVLSLEGAL